MIEADDADALARSYPYYDPIDTLPDEGKVWWRANADTEVAFRRATDHPDSARV